MLGNTFLVGNTQGDNVYQFNAATGEFLGEFITPRSGGLSSPDTLLYGPDVNNDGFEDLYVASGTLFGNAGTFGASAVLVYDGLTGAFVKPLVQDNPATVADETGGLIRPYGLAIGPDGLLYVSSFRSDKILRYNATTGAFVDVFASGNGTVNGLNGPNGLLFAPDGSLYVTTQGSVADGTGGITFQFNSQILRYASLTPGTAPTVVATPSPSLEGLGFASLLGLAIGPDGDLYVSDFANDIRRYNLTTGALVSSLSTNYTGTTPSGNFIGGLAFGPTDDLFVVGFDRATEIGAVLRYDGSSGSPVAPSTTLVTPNSRQRSIGITFQPDTGRSTSNVFTLSGAVASNFTAVTNILQFTRTGGTPQFTNEVGLFLVDDAQGKVGNLLPGSAGYLKAALARSRVLFSTLDNLPNGFNPTGLTKTLQLPGGSRVAFYLVSDGTTDGVLSGQIPESQVILGLGVAGSAFQVSEAADGTYTFNWDDQPVGDAKADNVILTFQTAATSTVIGTALQGNQQGEVIDLRGLTGQVQAQFIVNREAAFNNTVGFYAIVDPSGGIDTNSDGNADVNPGDAGYLQAAVSRQVGISLAVANQGTATFSGTFQAGSIFAPFIVSQGNVNALFDGDPNTNPDVFFPFLAANPGQVDYIRLLGDNTFGFEDVPSGGDFDYNDVIVQINLMA